MPKLNLNMHKLLTTEVGWRYDESTDRYYSTGLDPTWETQKRINSGIKQGAFPAKSLEEFHEKEQKKLQERVQRVEKMAKESAATVVPEKSSPTKEEKEAKDDEEPKAEKEPKAEAKEDAPPKEESKKRKAVGGAILGRVLVLGKGRSCR